MTVCFIVHANPHGKGRPRMANGHCYTPQTTRDYERLVAQEYKAQVKAYFSKGCPISVDITAYMPIPKSASKAKRAEMQSGQIKPIGKPDIDNICKAVLDALNGVAYADDTQVVKIRAEKLYSTEPCTLVAITDNTIF